MNAGPLSNFQPENQAFIIHYNRNVHVNIALPDVVSGCGAGSSNKGFFNVTDV